MAKSAPKFGLVWTGGAGRFLKYKKDSEGPMKAWRRLYERLGWSCVARGAGVIAYPPGFDRTTPVMAQVGVVHAIVVRDLRKRSAAPSAGSEASS